MTEQVEPAPRRVRAFLHGRLAFDTTNALYVWEWPYYPQYYIPLADVAAGVLDALGPETARVHDEGAVAGHVRFGFAALDAWFEEDERIFVHPRNPYTRVDALRSTRHVRIELDGVRLAESSSPVLVFETGLPTRYYFNRTEVDFRHLVPSATVTECPYKGTTSGYWSIRIGADLHEDLVWAYDFPTPGLMPIRGMLCFYNEKVDTFVDGEEIARPSTHFFTK
ncbi:DUF427 domain-containing protein [Amycolatopsis sp. 195334CR]|uniref:DUF427 domain-containing protein n=1 Tax=Amycolatopsis sp. 195334CR TaxID=2814588 RepID=UPI001A9036BB|nr:DUF427 domain-containing protein [Amycolatopsis sp. 195334CR]MBN6040239.1 DUF427 domain-containing protein [Amycolatopsis sp. 195334CR]